MGMHCEPQENLDIDGSFEFHWIYKLLRRNHCQTLRKLGGHTSDKLGPPNSCSPSPVSSPPPSPSLSILPLPLLLPVILLMFLLSSFSSSFIAGQQWISIRTHRLSAMAHMHIYNVLKTK